MELKKFEKFNNIMTWNANEDIINELTEINVKLVDNEIDLLVGFVYNMDDYNKLTQEFNNISKAKKAKCYIAFPKKASKKYKGEMSRDSFVYDDNGTRKFLDFPNVKFGGLISISDDFSAFVVTYLN